jgi:geranyl-CoA carboxylase alpha subunit
MNAMKKLLIANRGEIARRIIRTAHAMGIPPWRCIPTPTRRSLHVREATLACAWGAMRRPTPTCASTSCWPRHAKATGADAVHPGYGFLSENADFAQAVIDAGPDLGRPAAQAIRQLGSKSAAKAIAQAAACPVLPGYHGDDQSDERLLAEAQRIGLPLMVKAAAGGGGRGMRLVTDMAQLAARAQRAQRSRSRLWLG